MTNQPVWHLVTNLGDVNPLDYGGFFVYEDTTGVYPPEAERWDPDTHQAHRFALDLCAEISGGRLIPASIIASIGDLPYPITSYTTWFTQHIPTIARTTGFEPAELRHLFCSADIVDRARAYRALGEAMGWENLDGYPVHFSHLEASERYKS